MAFDGINYRALFERVKRITGDSNHTPELCRSALYCYDTIQKSVPGRKGIADEAHALRLITYWAHNSRKNSRNV